MNLENLKTGRHEIIDCEIKDQNGLNDFQKLPSIHGTSIPKVGIERFRVPLNFLSIDGAVRSHDVNASMYVNLEAGKTGVNMSRFCQILQNEAIKETVDDQFFEKVLKRFRDEMRDSELEDFISNSYLILDFSYCTKQASLKSKNWGYQYYKVKWQGHQNKLGELEMKLTINFEYSSTCPCSLSMAKQYEEEFARGETTVGHGVAVAHGQRSNACVTMTYSPKNPVSIEQFIELLKTALPTETQSLVKRVDEQAFAILNGENPMFVEHVARRLQFVLEEYAPIISFEAKIEHFESLHSHNAVAFIQST